MIGVFGGKKMQINVGCWRIEGLKRTLDDYQYEEIPDDAVFSIRSRDLLLEDAVSKGGRTPFRFWGLSSYDQGVVDLEIFLNEEDFPDWKAVWGNTFSFTGRREDRRIPLTFSHPSGEIHAQVGLSDSDHGLFVTVKNVKNNRRQVATLPLEAVEYEDRLTSIVLKDLSRCGWEPDQSEVDRIVSEVDRWNSTEWVELRGTYTELDYTYGDDDTRKYIRTERSGVWYQDPTGYFRGRETHPDSPWGVYGRCPRTRDAAREIQETFPVQIWLDKWLPDLLPQWDL